MLIGGNASILYLFLLNAAFRGAGDAPVALRSLALANGLNLVLDPCFIFGLGPFPELGVTGAAVATTIGRGVGCAYLFWYLFAGRGRLEFRARNLALSPSLIARLVRVSISGIGQFLIATSSWILVIRIIAMWGSAPGGGLHHRHPHDRVRFSPLWGSATRRPPWWARTWAPPARSRRSGGVGGGTLQRALHDHAGRRVLRVRAANRRPVFRRRGNPALRHPLPAHPGLGYPMYAVGMIITQALNGAGDTRTPSILNLIVFWLTQIPWPTGWLRPWTWARTACSGRSSFRSLLSVLGVLVFRRGAWRLQQV